MEGQKKKRARPFELELIKQFVRKRGRIGPVNSTLTLKALKPKKRKAIGIEEIEKDSGTRAKRLKVTPAEVEEGLRPSHTGPEIAEVTELLKSCFKGFGEFYFTGVYGAPIRSETETLWNYLLHLNIQTEPWLLAGEDLVWERFNKSLANTNWLQHFPDSWVEVLPVVISDHSSLIIHSHKSTHTPHKKPLHFEAMWLQHPQMKEIVKSAWQKQVTGSLSSQIQDIIKNVSKDLSLWHKENCGDLINQIKEAHTQVEKFQKNIHDHIRNNEELVTRKRLEFLLNCEEIKWAQRAKKLWLLKGDRNTKYFHSVVNHQRNKAPITSIQIQPGQWIEDQGGIKQAANEYFQQLYTSNDAADETARRQFISNYGTPKLNQGHIQHHSKPFTRLEIENAMFQMHAGKAPSPDGMTPMFFQHCWDTVQEDVTRMVGSFLLRGFLLRSMNQTHIALIPKMDSPSGFKDYRPISLCDTTYKLIAKVLTNRLQEVMPDLISPFQNAFVKGRLIQDNILIASGTLHYIRRCKKSKGGWATLKMDLQKAYDKISWAFLKDVLHYMNFPPLWQQMLMQCVTTTSMRVQISGEITEWFLPRVDDILLFFRADKSTCDTVNKLLNQFGELAGLWMNNQKSEVKFSPNITEERAQVLTRILNCQRVNHLGRYLGGYIDRYGMPP
ncbi:reverse transcriptase [Senna tora]|uniref:Reverse transcriptase n=1 Tax=Senna tora TaxID=362788 RepID=A0A834SVP3_9FABA|nr:reverse transcriptase [Senna tora]